MDEIIENKTLINIEKQSINKYLVIYQEKHKPKYGYVVEFAEKYLILITVCNIDRKLQKKINKKH